MNDKDVNRKLALASLLVLLTVLIIIFDRLTGCSTQPATVITQVAPTPEPVACGELKVGDVRKDACPPEWSGDRIMVCTDRGLETALDTCVKTPDECESDAEGKVTFEKHIKPLVAAKCLSCHFTPRRYDEYETAKPLADEIIRRINLAADNIERMPRVPNQELSVEERTLIRQWRDDGLINNNECPPNDPGGGTFQFQELENIESELIQDLGNLDSDDRENTRWLVMTHKYDYQAPLADLAQFEKAINKTVNSINATEDEIYLASAIDAKKTIYRIDLRSYGLTTADWLAIEAADKLKIVSFTQKGEIIKLLTKTAQPWVHFDNFADVTQRNSTLYYRLTNTPNTFIQLAQQTGVLYGADFLNFEAMLIGFNGSPISNQKNRLLSRHESNDGYFWTTYDPIEIANVPERNLFEFPLIDATGSTKIFEFAASEVIYTMPNGLQGYALFNAVGTRQDVAPVNIVRDTESPLSAEIRNANSCHRCHANGRIAATDQIRNHVLDNASQFDVADVEIIKLLYRPDNANSAQFSTDNLLASRALAQLGIKPGDVDPINFCTDKFLSDWTLEQLATFLFIPVPEFKVLLGQSAAARLQIGQLLSGGTITYDQFVAVLPVLIKDLRLFQDPLNQ